MKKHIPTVMLSVCLFCLLGACKNYSSSIDDYLSYWSTAAAIETYRFTTATHTDAKGTQWVSSTAPATVTFTVRNPRNFELKNPADADAPTDSITFPYIQNEPDTSAATTPKAGRDYTFKKISNTEFELSYTPAFLQQYEWGSVDITPTIVLHTADGRMFKQTIPFTLKVNTPPPAIEKCVIARTKTASAAEPAYYVLCLQLPAAEMNRELNGSLVHKDIAGITINETSYSLSIDSAQRQLNVKAGSPFIGKDSVEKLAAADAEEIPSGWTLYFKTDVAVGDAKKAYTISVKDEKGLYSKPVTAATQLSEPQPAQAAVITGTKIDSLPMDGTAQDKAIVIKAADAAPEAQIKLSVPATGGASVTGVTIHYTLTEVGQTPAPEQTRTSPITVDMPLNGAGEKMYALTYFTDGVGFKPSASKTVYYKVVKEHTVTFNLAGGNIDGKTNDITMTDIQGMPFTAPANPRRDGYTFTGWNPALPSPPVYLAADTTYTAQWTAHQYKVHFNGNGSTAGSMSEQGFTYDIPQELQYNRFEKTGYTFRGWANAYNPTEPVYTDGQRVTNLSSGNNTVVQLFAVWQINTYTVTFNVDGKNGTLSATPQGGSENSTGTITVEHGKSVTFTATPTEGWEVDSWTGVTPDTSSPDKTKATLSSVTNTTTVTVKFKKKQAKKVSDWEALRTAVKNASDGDVIEVTGNITYGFTGTKSTITVESNITIKSSTEGPKYILSANGKGADGGAANAKVQSIFEVEKGKTLTLENVKLTKAEKYAVYVEENSSLTMKNVTIIDCKTQDNAAGIYFNKGKDLTLEHCIIEKCKGKGSQSSGGIDIQVPKGTVSIKDTEIKNCEAKANGGGINLYKAAGTLENVKVDSCSAKSGGGIYAKGGTLTITGGYFKNNSTGGTGQSDGGGAIYNEGAKVTITGCTIGDDDSNKGNYAGQGGGIFVNGGAECILEAGTKIIGNSAIDLGTGTGNGGGVYVAGNSSLKMENVTIKNCEASGTDSAGGGVYLYKGTCTLEKVIVEECKAPKGGGIFISADAECILKEDVKILQNEAMGTNSNGGGIFVDKVQNGEQSGTLTIKGSNDKPVVIANNGADNHGGGLYSFGTVNIEYAEIKENTVTHDGGGMYNEGICTMDNVTIQNNRASDPTTNAGRGGGIYSNDKLTLTDTTVTGNEAKTGGGVYLEQGRFTIVGSTRITPSTEATDGKNDVFLKTGRLITIVNALTEQGIVARITPETYTVGVKVLQPSTEYAKFTVTPKDGNTWSITSDGALKKP